MISTLTRPVLPAASRTTAVSVWPPFATVVIQGIDTGPVSDVVSLATMSPSTSRLKVFDHPLAPLTQRTTQAVPATTSPPEGWVMATSSVSPAGGGGGGGAGSPVALLPETRMVRLARPVLPEASRTVAVSVCAPFGIDAHGSVTGPRVDVV